MLLSRLNVLVVTGLFLGACSQEEPVSTVFDASAVYRDSSMVFQLSHNVLKKAADKQIEEPVQVNEWLNGAWVSGSGTTKAWTDFELVESDGKARLDTLTYSRTETNTSGSADRASFCAHNLITTGSRTSLEITSEGLTLSPSRTNASADVTITCVNTSVGFPFRRLALRRATREINAQVPTTERILWQRAINETNTRLDQEAQAALSDPGIDRLNTMKDDFVAAGFEGRIGFSSSPNAMRMAVAKPENDSFPHPVIPEDQDLLMMIHSSMLSEYMENEFAGEQMTQAEFDQKFKKLMGLMVDDSPRDPAQAETSIKFADSAPVMFEMHDDSVVITIRGDEWVTVNNTYREKMDVIATYKVATDDQGLTLLRDENIKVIPRGYDPANGPLPIRMQIIAGALRSQFAAAMDMRFLKSKITLEGNMAKAGELTTQRLFALDNWLVIGYKGQ